MYERFFKRLIDIVLALIGSVVLLPRSEERRVGKECYS